MTGSGDARGRGETADPGADDGDLSSPTVMQSDEPAHRAARDRSSAPSRSAAGTPLVSISGRNSDPRPLPST